LIFKKFLNLENLSSAGKRTARFLASICHFVDSLRAFGWKHRLSLVRFELGCRTGQTGKTRNAAYWTAA